MKKLFILLSLSLSLFLAGCNSIYENHHRTTKLIINLPKAANYSSRQIYKENELTDIDPSSTSYIIYLSRVGETLDPIETRPGETQIMIPDLKPGTWTISCLASLEDCPAFAFDEKKQIELRAGDIKSINLSLSKNQVNKIQNIDVISKNTSYALGETLNTSGNSYNVNLTNGYSFSFNEADLKNLLEIDIINAEFVLDESAPENIVNNYTDPSVAGRYCYNIKYNFSDSLETIVPAEINAKKPIITTQPQNTFITSRSMAYNNGTAPAIEYTLSLEIQEDSDYGIISYEWIDSPICTGERYDSTGSDTNTYYFCAVNAKNIQTSNFNNNVHYCKVTNTDNKGGLNGSITATTDSKNAIVLPYNPYNPLSSSNNNYTIDSVSIGYDNDYYAVQGQDPDPNRLYLNVKLVSLHNGTVNYSYVHLYNGDELYNVVIDVSKKEDGSIDYDSTFGLVPYNVNYSYKKYTPTGNEVTREDGTKGTVYVYTSDDITETNKEIHINTKVPAIPDYEISLRHPSEDKKNYYRAYDPGDGSTTGQWYIKENENDDYTSTDIGDLLQVQCNTVGCDLQFIDFTSNSYVTNHVQAYTCDFVSYKKNGNNKITKSELTKTKFNPLIATESSQNYNVYSNIYALNNVNEIIVLEEGQKIEVYINCVKSVNKTYEPWFIDLTPKSVDSPSVYYSKYTN